MYARQAITTRYLVPTNHRGSRIVAKCDAGRLVVSWDHALNTTENHAAAARALAGELGWDGPAHIGSTSAGFVLVFTVADTAVL